MSRSKRTIQAGAVGNDIWIGRYEPFYEVVAQPLGKRKIHVLRFSVDEAKVAIEMLQAEIDRATNANKER